MVEGLRNEITYSVMRNLVWGSFHVELGWCEVVGLQNGMGLGPCWARVLCFLANGQAS